MRQVVPYPSAIQHTYIITKGPCMRCVMACVLLLNLTTKQPMGKGSKLPIAYLIKRFIKSGSSRTQRKMLSISAAAPKILDKTPKFGIFSVKGSSSSFGRMATLARRACISALLAIKRHGLHPIRIYRRLTNIVVLLLYHPCVHATHA